VIRFLVAIVLAGIAFFAITYSVTTWTGHRFEIERERTQQIVVRETQETERVRIREEAATERARIHENAITTRLAMHYGYNTTILAIVIALLVSGLIVFFVINYERDRY
jgi:Flp pilus assembly protein TadB